MQPRSRKISILAYAVGALSAWFCASPAYALDDLIEGAKLCTRQLPHYEREYAIPTHLLSAIASTESGRYHQGLGLKVPWPWTINVEGKGYFFPSKQEAMAAVHKFQARGIQSIDVGCMQVNLFQHPHAFSSLDQAFEPQTNVAYAASFLRDLYQEEHSWKKAAADYHSRTPVLGTQYAGVVYDSWYQILEKLRLAKQQVGTMENGVQIASNEQPAPFVRSMDSPMNEETPAAPKALPEQQGKKVSAYHSPHMNLVQLSKKDTSHENGVIVVRPEIQADNSPIIVSTASAASSDTTSSSSAPDAKIVHVSDQGNSSSHKNGPTFIFND